MTGTCKLCRQLVSGDPVLEVGPARVKAEFLSFAEAMRLHVGVHHKDQLQVFAGLLTMAAQVFSSLYADCPLDDYAVGLASMRAFLADRILDAAVVVTSDTPVASPLVVP